MRRTLGVRGRVPCARNGVCRRPRRTARAEELEALHLQLARTELDLALLKSQLVRALPDFKLFQLLDALSTERELFVEKDFLREQWREIERRGEAEAWLHGVGEGENPVQEWDDLMWRVYRRTERS